MREVPRFFPTDFEPEQQGLVDARQPVLPDEIGLAEQVSAIVAIIVGAELDLGQVAVGARTALFAITF